MGKSQYHLLVEPHLDEVRELSKQGYNEKEIASVFGVPERTWRVYKKERAALSAAIVEGRRKAQSDITNALYKRATGFTEQVEELVAVRDAQNNLVRHDVKRIKKYFPPDMGAIRMWLGYRSPEKWGDKSTDRQTELELVQKIYNARDSKGWTALETARAFEREGIALPESLRMELAKETKESIVSTDQASIRIVLPSEIEREERDELLTEEATVEE